ncbi:diguanylate cyclase [Rugamonas sp.]|uniref:sensor domain-containing diguanylate cyclase n=1 Tax=Rugamonas sp. TaxID=1926287 RepID=UPI0025E0979C|nr:diguanylate cyclase [Rugamonas sp.]
MIKSTSHAVRFLRKLYRVILLPVFALALLAAMWATTIYQVGLERDNAHYDAVLHCQSLARTLSEHSSHILRQTEHATQLFKLKYEETDGALRLPEFTRPGGLLDSLLPSKLDLPIVLLDARGDTVDAMHGVFPAGLGKQAFFQTLSGNDQDAPLVTTPVLDARTKKWMIQIARRLNDGAGHFAGAVAIMIDPAYFVEDYDRLNVDDQGVVLLISRDTGLSTGRLNEELVISDALDFSAPAKANLAPDELQLSRPFDSVRRVYSYRDLPRYALMAVVGISTDVALERYERQRRMYYGAVSVASVIVLIFVSLMMQQSVRLRRSMRTTIEAQQRQRAASDASLDATFLLKACRPRERGGKLAAVDDFIFVDLNERGASLLRRPRGEVLGQRIGELLPTWREQGFIAKYARVLASGVPLEEEFTLAPAPGQTRPRWLHHQIVAIADGVAITTREITERKEAELAMRQKQAELAAMNDASPLGLIHADPSGHCTYVNRTFETITGLTRAEALGDAWMRAVHPNDREVLAVALKHLTETQLPFQNTLRCVHLDGTIVWISFKVAAIVIDGHIDGYVGTVDDITLVRKSVMALRESEARLRTIADTLPAMIAYIDFDEIYRFHNLAYEREFCEQDLQVRGHTVSDTVGEARYAFLQPYIKSALRGQVVSFEEEDDSCGYDRVFEVNYIPQFDEDHATVVGFHVMRQDITAQKREKQRLLKLSQIDALTGLTNRAGFLQKLNDAMAACRENASMIAVMYMDVDHFKPVNDTYGHSVGDALLKAFSSRLTHTMRASDTVARLGGDEFTIIMERVNKVEDAATLAGKIVTAMQAPFEIGSLLINISASIGLTFYGGEEIEAAELLNRADMLLYQAKQAGRNTYRAGPPQAALSTAPSPAAPAAPQATPNAA